MITYFALSSILDLRYDSLAKDLYIQASAIWDNSIVEVPSNWAITSDIINVSSKSFKEMFVLVYNLLRSSVFVESNSNVGLLLDFFSCTLSLIFNIVSWL